MGDASMQQRPPLFRHPSPGFRLALVQQLRTHADGAPVLKLHALLRQFDLPLHERHLVTDRR